MICPHCQTAYHPDESETTLGNDDARSFWKIRSQNCPACGKKIIKLVELRHNGHIWTEQPSRYVNPRGVVRPDPPKEVDDEFAQDYIEASLVLSESPKASAALSRRCLQHLIREKAGIKKNNLADEIQALIDSQQLPSHLSEAIDAIRNIGNFAAHPMKSTASGEIIEVEPGEAEWTLDVLDGLFDFYFVQPAILKAKKAALDAKLASAGKPPTK